LSTPRVLATGYFLYLARQGKCTVHGFTAAPVQALVLTVHVHRRSLAVGMVHESLVRLFDLAELVGFGVNEESAIELR
jgi:hypothetical protein